MECYMLSVLAGASGSDYRHVEKVYHSSSLHILDFLYSNIVGLVAQG
jgi:hypothetical protein